MSSRLHAHKAHKQCSIACLQCSVSMPKYRCCLSNHASLPLHVIQKWEGERFVKMAIQDLGLQLQLGHFDGSSYINPEQAGQTFVGMDINGLHKFHSLTLASKISGYDFYKSLTHMMDAMGLKVPKFWHLKMMMCPGRGQEEDGMKKTSEGRLPLRCPAYPILGVNLPNSWMGCMPEKRYIYQGLFALDTKFWLKNLQQSNSDVDPGLHTGLTYMVKYVLYLVHVKKFASQKDISTCSRFKTLTHVETKGEASLQVTEGNANGNKGRIYIQRNGSFSTISYCALTTAYLLVSPNDVYIPTSNIQVRPATTQAQHLPLTSSAPHYTSHIEPIFYEGMAHQLHHEKVKQLKEPSCLETMVHTKHEVTVFSWPENRTEPRPAVLQEGYAFSWFRITDDVLAEVGLATKGCIPPRFELFKPEYAHSSNIRTNLTAEQQKAQQLLYDSFVQAPSSQTTSSSKHQHNSGDKTPRRKKKAIDSSDESDNDHRDCSHQPTRTARSHSKCPSPFVYHDFDYALLTPYNPPPSPWKLTNDEEDDLPSAAMISISRHSISSRSSSSASGLSKFGSSTSDMDTSSSSQSCSHSQSQSQSCLESPVVQAFTLTDMEDPEDKTDTSSSSADESPSSSSNDKENASWSNSFYVSDLVGFFMTHCRLLKEVLAKQFKEVFRIEWTKSAYYYLLQVWDNCHDSEAKEAALKAGYTPKGSWTLFCKQYPHKSVVAKVEKQRQQDFQKTQSVEKSAKSKGKQPVKTH
ncbi:hypothetical protein ARMGADRAFT_1036529 [Armillaria gallica]|uniref:CxC2-like cysteine cluster KDZ transposase-associated domain-containing protein n=1 Tax=Armillaria gallica TaxID=47427 RepID=A0A2H3CQ92_ARMGA|nr:hypothetical protein ARMGADRAFT_1036529 [Armillaria gallica]